MLRPSRSDGPQPTVVLLHGGFWRWPYGRWLMWPLVRDVRARGWCSLNVSYRRLGRFGGAGGWPETFDDVRAATEMLRDHPGVVDAERVVVVGHSAGAHLGLWSAKEVDVDILGVVSMAGLTDLEPSWNRSLPAVRELLAHVPAERRFALTSPRHRLPLGVRVVCVHGSDDTTVRPSMSTEFVDAATDTGDDATLAIVPGEDHRDALRPGSAMWSQAVTAIEEWFAASRNPQGDE